MTKRHERPAKQKEALEIPLMGGGGPNNNLKLADQRVWAHVKKKKASIFFPHSGKGQGARLKLGGGGKRITIGQGREGKHKNVQKTRKRPIGVQPELTRAGGG